MEVIMEFSHVEPNPPIWVNIIKTYLAYPTKKKDRKQLLAKYLSNQIDFINDNWKQLVTIFYFLFFIKILLEHW
jgi:hypothetical protein